jgi:hypothetical protein
MAAGGEDFGDASGGKTFRGHTQGCPQPRASGADNDYIVSVIDYLVGPAHSFILPAKL